MLLVKPTILYKLKLGEIVTTIPTIGKLLLHGIQDGCHYSCMPRLLSRGTCFHDQAVLEHCQLISTCRLQRGDGGVQEH